MATDKLFADANPDSNTSPNRKDYDIWVEKYRPSTLEEYVGSSLLIEKSRQWIEEGVFPSLLFHGKAGVGKTTLALILAKSIDASIKIINASDDRGIDTVRDNIKNFINGSTSRTWKVVILDEADNLTPDAQDALRAVIETSHSYARFILTGNTKTTIIPALENRCQVFEIIPPLKKDVGLRLLTVLDAEAVTYDLKEVKALVEETYPSVRGAIKTAQQYTTRTPDGSLVLSYKVGSENKETVAEIAKLIAHAKTDSIIETHTKIRQLVLDSRSFNFEMNFTALYNQVKAIADLTSDPNQFVAESIVLINDYQYKHAFVPDKELNFSALIINLILLRLA